MDKNGDGDDDSEGGGNVEGKSDSDAVEKTVNRQTSCPYFSPRSGMLVLILMCMAMEYDKAVEDHVNDEAESSEGSDGRDGI